MGKLERRTFEKGIDMDSDLTGVQEGFAKWMLNCLSESGDDVTNIKGNLRAEFEEDFTFFTDNTNYTYRCIGSKYDPIYQKNYFFVSAQDDSSSPIYQSFIFEYDVVTGIVNVVCDEYWSDVLEFEFDELITAISIVFIDTTIPLLYWTQRAGLRKINVYKAKQTYAQTGGYADLVLESIDRIKYPPAFAPEIKQLTDISFIGNNLQKTFFQFSYRNSYDDYDVSAPSDWSRVNIPYVPYASVSNDIPLFQESQRNNCIYITLKKPFSTVTKLDLFVREKTSDVGLEINFDWIIYDTIIVADVTWDDNDEYIYKFYNDKVGELVTQAIANKIEDRIPLSAVARDIGETNRDYIGNITEGFDLEPIDVDVSFTETPFIDVANAGSVQMYAYENIAPSVDAGVCKLPLTPDDLEVGGTIQIQFKDVNGDVPGNYNFQYVIQDGDLGDVPFAYPYTLRTNIEAAYLQYRTTDWISMLTTDPYTIYLANDTPATPIDNDQIISAFYLPNLRNCLPQFKNRHIHYFAISYGDEGGRRSSVQKAEKYYHSADLQEVLKGRMTINHTPPDWAYYYYVYYAGFDAGNFYQIKILDIGAPDDNGNLTLVVDWLQTGYRYKDVTFLEYTYSVGDRIKFLYGNVDGSLADYIDVAVLSIGAANNEIIIEGSFQITQLLENNDNFLIEIYKKSTQSGFYYTIDKNYIGDAGLSTRYHMGNIQDQDPSGTPSANPAIQEFFGVNTYIRPRYYTFYDDTNLYTLFNAISYIQERIWLAAPSAYPFRIELKVYDDVIGGNQVLYFVYNFSSSYRDNAVDEITLALNDSTNWTSTDPSFSANFFTANYTAVGDNTNALFLIFQNSDYGSLLYFQMSVSDNPPTSTVDDNAVQSVISDPYQFTLIIEDPNQSDIFVGTTTGDGSSTSGSAVTSFGKPNIENINFRQITRENTVYHTDPLIPESNINGLSSIGDGYFKDYGANYGGIYRLFNDGRNMRMLMELKCAYIPVNQLVSGNSGSPVIVETEQILTPLQYMAGLHGIGKHPESWDFFENSGYFVDPINYDLCRWSNDGITVISNVQGQRANGTPYYLVRKYLRNRIKSNTGNFVGAFNSETNCYEVHLGCLRPVVWHEGINNFIGERSYDFEMAGTIGEHLVSFKNGYLYVHGVNPVYNNFYNRQYTSQVWAAFNEGSFNKIYLNLRVKSLSKWSMPEGVNTVGQQTILQEQNFEQRENVFYAEFLRDINTPNLTLPIFEGAAMRDNCLLIKMDSASVEFERLQYLEVNQIESK